MKRIMVFGLGVGMAALTACSDTAGPEGDRLSRVEALRLAADIMAASEGTTATASASAGVETDQAGGPTTFTHTHESSHPCPSGGTLDVDLVLEGSVDTDTNSFQADLSGSHTHNACAFPHASMTLTVGGAPTIAFSASVGTVNGVPSQPFTFSLDGGFTWSASDGRSGSCQMTLDAVTDFTARERIVEGTICGHSIRETTTWS